MIDDFRTWCREHNTDKQKRKTLRGEINHKLRTCIIETIIKDNEKRESVRDIMYTQAKCRR